MKSILFDILFFGSILFIIFIYEKINTKKKDIKVYDTNNTKEKKFILPDGSSYTISVGTKSHNDNINYESEEIKLKEIATLLKTKNREFEIVHKSSEYTTLVYKKET